MFKNAHTAMARGRGAETAEDVIGLLTAISVISKRLAKTLALQEQTPTRKEGGKRNGRKIGLPRNAD